MNYETTIEKKLDFIRFFFFAQTNFMSQVPCSFYGTFPMNNIISNTVGNLKKNTHV